MLGKEYTDLVTELHGRDEHGQRDWYCDIPLSVSIACLHCGTDHQCEVTFDTERGTAHAQIDTDACEECGKALCSKCPRYPHPDDKDLIRCADCAGGSK